MMRLKKRAIIVPIFILLIIISGCKSKKDTAKSIEEIRTGTEGIVVSFVPNAPPDKIHVTEIKEEEIDFEKVAPNDFDAILELRNKGAFPQPGEGVLKPGSISTQGNVYLSGYDNNIIQISPEAFNLPELTLEGKSTINPNGGLDLVTFKGKVNVQKLNVEKYEPTLLATVCYDYETTAGPSVCIDPNPYSTVKEKKVCGVQDITLSSQGAPIAVTRINEEALATKTQFKITIKNVGGGDVIRYIAREKCSPLGKDKLQREDVDKVWVSDVKISNKPLICGPFVDGNVKAESGFVRLINGEGFIICDYSISQYGASKTAFLTPLTIKLGYVYRTTAEKKIQIKKETSGIGGIGDGADVGSKPETRGQEYLPYT